MYLVFIHRGRVRQRPISVHELYSHAYIKHNPHHQPPAHRRRAHHSSHRSDRRQRADSSGHAGSLRHGGEDTRGHQSRACSSYAMAKKRLSKTNVFVKPDGQGRACSRYAMAKKRLSKTNLFFPLGAKDGEESPFCPHIFIILASIEKKCLKNIDFFSR